MPDAIIVFGASIHDDGTLTQDSIARMDAAIKLWNEKAAPVIVCCGKWSFTRSTAPTKTEAEGMADYALAHGVPPDALRREEQSTDTTGNAYFAKKIFAEPPGWHSLVVVTADYHLPRTKYICRKVFGAAYDIEYVAVPLDHTPEGRAKLDRHEKISLSITTEWFDGIADGDDAAIWHILDTRHPGYSAHPTHSHEDVRRLFAEREARLASGQTI